VKGRKLLNSLVRLRDARLKDQSAQLKKLSVALSEIEQRKEAAQASAAQSIEAPESLANLEALGQSRIKYAKLAVKAEQDVRAMVQKVGHSRKLADSARDAVADLRRATASERDASMEREAENFFSWSKVFGR
jgi:hypothetical protein